jgi:acyl-coenzyme A synthetase/AMP-(fatty) acid ligase
VDGVLMSHPQVAEAVAFGCPDEKYGEIVAAAIVPNQPVSDTAAFAKDIQKQAGQKMAAFKVIAATLAHHAWCHCLAAIKPKQDLVGR